MPHMMPMMWMFTFMFSLFILFSILCMIYFFYLPKLTNLNILIKMKDKSNWIWKW